MNDLIKERTRYPALAKAIFSVAQIDSIWKADYPGLESWRTYQHPQNGWPEGVFKRMAVESNGIRDEFLCQAIIESVLRGERVFVSMGVSHAPRIEATLREMLH